MIKCFLVLNDTCLTVMFIMNVRFVFAVGYMFLVVLPLSTCTLPSP